MRLILKKYSFYMYSDRLGAQRLGFNSQQGEMILSFPEHTDQLWDPSNFLSNVYWELFLHVLRGQYMKLP
jgi:hypothetical protein